MGGFAKASSVKAACQFLWGFLLCAAFAVTAAPAPMPSAAMMPMADRLKIEKQLTEEIQTRINQQERIEGQSKAVSAQARFDHPSKRVIVDLSRGYIPKYAGGELEDLEAELRTVVEELLMGLVDFSGVDFRYDGRPIQYFHPDPPRSTLRSDGRMLPGSRP